MDAVIRQPQLDELGLPIRGPNEPPLPDISEDAMQRLINGDFSDIGLPMPSSMPTREEAQSEARERSTDVISSWNTLRQILERHEDVIRKRWTKKTKVQRGKIIQAAWPNMSAKHRPDYEAIFREGRNLQKGKTRFREAYMWPYINVEDLAKGKALLLLLNSRGRHPPNMFAHADFNATRVGHVSAAIMPAFLNVHSMLLDGETFETYGRVVSWDEDEEAMMKTFNGLGFQPGQGLWILEIQQKVLRFLVDCCYAILHEFSPDLLVGAEVQVIPEPPSMVGSSEYPTLATMAAEAPYRLPARLDFTHLKALTAAKLASAMDHVRSLREDPGYFADVLGDWAEHRQEKLLDTNGERHPVLDKPLFWDRVMGNAIGDAYGLLHAWNLISEQLTELSSLQTKYALVISPHETLPTEYMKALLALRYTLDQAAKAPINHLKTGFTSSPPLRSQFLREPQVPGSNMIYVRGKQGSRSNSDPMMWLFTCLWTENQLELLTLPGLMDEIEYLAQKDPTEKAKISPWVAGVLSDLGLIAHLRHELDIYLPWAAGYDHAYVDHRAAIEGDFPRLFSGIHDVVRNLSVVPFAKFGSPTEGRFHYPSDKKRTKQNTESMRTAEHNLDVFWANVDETCRSKTGRSFGRGIQHLFKEQQPMERTPEWIEPIKEQKKAAMDKSGDGLSALSALQLGSADSPTRFVPPQPKVKPKTRGTTQSTSNGSLEGAGAPVEEDRQPIFTLKARAFKVFMVLFYKPSQNDLPGEVSWADFLFAMAATGFAPEKLYGSVWQFTPSDLDVERSIQFHEPHPVGKIPFRNMRRMGRRLNRAYGWNGGMFTLE
ncbi:hypothetical protein LOCC1_G004658 [Lachnellula occidentalis]|uniref:Uncharacterized protein n=1 Tax=Lachnellula occidentalis TaxID=215460 RepID=A0A8H8UIL6_9HELO|nr:hypothetical protein LOCC1_G004658 [Lachnellula occidentalis]